VENFEKFTGLKFFFVGLCISEALDRWAADQLFPLTWAIFGQKTKEK
jgi:hypothetical protein